MGILWASAHTSTDNISLDPNLYRLDPTALEFFQQQTGITEEDDLKHHILAVQAKPFAVVITSIDVH
ncbi:hypothetical protein BDR04DRAFT_830161 [Suillus decipiens]|nr:hypothetical protein BDR04DRAFT_830161 [Suillus decipiens]